MSPVNLAAACYSMYIMLLVLAIYLFFHENRSLMCTQATVNMWAVVRPIRIIVVEVCFTITQLEGDKY